MPNEPIAPLRWWWTPLALNAVMLVLLGAVPLVTSSRVAALRRHASDVTLPALVLVNDLEAALATETAAEGEITRDGARMGAEAAADARAARLATIDDEHRLDSLVRTVGPASVERFTEARAAIGRWQSLIERCEAPERAASAECSGRERWAALRHALVSTRALEDELTARSADARIAIQRVERIALLVPSALVTAALLALAAVVWTARRTRVLVQEAREGRLSAEHARESREALMRGVTHDLKNPLGAAAGYADLLADGVVGPLAEAQALIVSRLRRLLATTLATVNELLDLSRDEAGELNIQPASVDLALVLHDSVEDYRASAATSGVSLICEPEMRTRGLPLDASLHAPLLTDATRVRRILGNLLSNALKYTPRGGEVHTWIETAVDPELGVVLVVTVADNGPGIPAPLRERVFDEFFRVDSTSVLATGSGVGLTTARRVARILGGDVRLRDDGAMPGATFALLLPLGRNEQHAERSPAHGTGIGWRALASTGATPVASSSISHSSTETGRLP